jgi:hypothetical protein
VVLYEQMASRQQTREHDVKHTGGEMHSQAHVVSQAHAEIGDYLDGRKRRGRTDCLSDRDWVGPTAAKSLLSTHCGRARQRVAEHWLASFITNFFLSLEMEGGH